MKIFGHVIAPMYLWTIACILFLVGVSSYTLDFFPLALIVATLSTVIFELLFIKFYKKHKLRFPSSAIITGLIIGCVAPFNAPLALVILASVVAVASKFLIKSKHSNVFNPATLGLLVALFVFSAGDAWWAGINYNVLGVAVPLSLVLLISAYKARRLVTAVSFVAASIVLGTILSITYGNSVLGSLAGAVIGLNYFFGLLMIADPKTSPHKNLEQLVYGVGVAVIVAILGLFVIVYPLLISLLIGNVSYAVYKKYGHLLSKSKEIHPATAHAQSTV